MREPRMNLLTDETVRPKEHYRFQFDPVQRIINYDPAGNVLTKEIHRDIFNILRDMTRSGITDAFWT